MAQVVLLSNSRSERINRHIRIEVMLVIGQEMRRGLEMECAEDSRVIERRDEEAVNVQDFGRDLKQKMRTFRLALCVIERLTYAAFRMMSRVYHVAKNLRDKI